MLTTPKIDLLPEHLIDQIKAGEIIERPGNLLKEILENSVDAGSTKIELILKNNGLDFISLKDNGHGMNFDDLPLAFSRHATSKISRFEDLYQLHTFGFRGEALASISAISKLQCISYTLSEPEGSEIRIEGGQTIGHSRRMSAREPGTELIIQDLFFNTPARLKFIQSQNSEKQFLKRVIYSFVLSHPEIEFHLKFDEAEKEIYLQVPSILERIKDLVPKVSLTSILHSERSYDSNVFSIYLVPAQYKTPVKFQYTFINGRLVTDKQYPRIISNALISAFGHDEFYYLSFFDIPTDHIDVNVHPTKTLIKIFDQSKVISLATSTIKDLKNNEKVQAPRSDFAPHPEQSINQEVPQNFFGHLDFKQDLVSGRQEYNMEGIFSPHRTALDESGLAHLIWINGFFIKNIESTYIAFSAQKLIEQFVLKMMKTSTPTLPLLVSEPFDKNGIHLDSLENLSRAGAEFDLLGGTTYVLRGIPEWMNGFPLKEIISTIIYRKSFKDILINDQDWSSSTWTDMINQFSITELYELKVAANLENLLKEKLW